MKNDKEQGVLKIFIKYVSLNVMGMLGLSSYILADTFFVAKAMGTNGLAALNFSISIFSIINGIALMIGIGGATKYSIVKAQNDKNADEIFGNAIEIGLFAGVIFIIIGVFLAGDLAQLLGADEVTMPLTEVYLRIILIFAPFFIANGIMLAFVRNDNNPNLSMIAMLIGSLLNILLDYILIVKLSMGMFGAAFATGLAPILSLCVLSLHFLLRKNQFNIIFCKIKFSYICNMIKLGLSAFITEVSSGVVLITFNLIIFGLMGNVGVAAYGIVANIAMVVIAIFTGIAQGIQPIASKAYGQNNEIHMRHILRYGIIFSLALSFLIYILVFLNTEKIVEIFNSNENSQLAMLAQTGIRIYFVGFFFAGINIIFAAYLSAVDRARGAFLISIMRGFTLLLPVVFVCSFVWEMTGVWWSYVITELIVMLGIVFSRNKNKACLLRFTT